MPVPPKENLIAQISGMNPLDARCDQESLAIRKADGWRTERPKRRPPKTKGHCSQAHLLEDIGRKLKDKKVPEIVKAPAVADKPLPDFAMRLIRERPECDFTKGPLGDLSFGILSLTGTSKS